MTKYESCNWKDVLVMINYKFWNTNCYLTMTLTYLNDQTGGDNAMEGLYPQEEID